MSTPKEKQGFVVNLFGEPCAGKSTVSAMLFAIMKLRGHNVELIQEYAKDLVYEHRLHTLQDQLYLLGKQNHRLVRTVSQVELVINDSPIVLSSLYSPPDYYKGFDSFVMEVFNSYNNVNFFMTRPKSRPYQPSGRTQTASQALEVRDKLLTYMHNHNISYTPLNSDINTAATIYTILCDTNIIAPRE
jgi:hypothetical protein